MAFKILNRKEEEGMMIKVHKHKGHKYQGPARVSLRMPNYHELLNFGYKIRHPATWSMYAKALKDKEDLYLNPLLANVFTPRPKKGIELRHAGDKAK